MWDRHINNRYWHDVNDRSNLLKLISWERAESSQREQNKIFRRIQSNVGRSDSYTTPGRDERSRHHWVRHEVRHAS